VSRTQVECLLLLFLAAGAVGCGELVTDLTGTRCDAGRCVEGYFCDVDDRCKRGMPPSPLDGGGEHADAGGAQDAGVDAGADGGDAGHDGGADDGGVDACDAAVCGTSDGCCPSECDATQDLDCEPVCGNTVQESGEICDDGNTNNGDNCDPTCRYFNVVATLSGVPGSKSFADSVAGEGARFTSPYGITGTPSYLYVVDIDNATVRQVKPAYNTLPTTTTTTLAGRSYWREQVDGVGQDAGFSWPTHVVLYPFDTFNDQRLYIADQGIYLRELRLDGGQVITLDPDDGGLAVSGVSALSRRTVTDTDYVLVLDNLGLRQWNPRDGGLSQITSLQAISQVTGGLACSAVAELWPDYLVGCGSKLVRARDDGGTSLYAGSTQGCSDGDGGLLDSKFWSISGLSVVAYPNYSGWGVYVSDSSCHTVRRIGGSASAPSIRTIAGQPFSTGLVDGDKSVSRFDGPRVYAHGGVAGSFPERVYVADQTNAAIRLISSPNGSAVVSTLAGRPDNYELRLDGGAQSRYLGINELASSSDGGFVYATLDYQYNDLYDALLRISLADGSPELLATVPRPRAVTELGGVPYLALANGTIQRVLDGGVELFAGTAGQLTPTTDGPRLSAKMNPTSLTTDGTDLYFMDGSAKTLRKITVATGSVSTQAGGAQAGVAPDGGTLEVVDGIGQAARFLTPRGLACDGQRLFFVDANGTVVRQVQLSNRQVSTLAGEPGDYRHVDGPGSSARFAYAYSVATDGRSLFISDPGFGYGAGTPEVSGPSIRQLDLPTGQVSTMVGATGQWTTLNGIGRAARFAWPGPLTTRPGQGSVIVYDMQEMAFRAIY
jgi:cysteine-rich repeat protein